MKIYKINKINFNVPKCHIARFLEEKN